MKGRELLRLEGIKKCFGSVEVLRGLDLSVDRGEFITLLGSSGCGKTTTLRIIAGLESADSGSVFIDGQDVGGLEPNRRGVNMVFQNYALFPHMNVEQNIGYSLRLKGLAKPEIKKTVNEALALVQLSGYERRRPNELSGGQRQRVAVARAVVNRPKVLLLDEPLGALDLQLRRQMQIELKRLQKQLGITFIYITHDQEEALAMSDRIAVMRNGVFEQVGSAAEVYDHPGTSFVAKFVGGANILSGTVVSRKDFGGGKQRLVFKHSGGLAAADYKPPYVPQRNIEAGEMIRVAVRGEHLLLQAADHDAAGMPAGGHSGEFSSGPVPAELRGLPAVVTGKSFAGGLLRITVRLRNAGSGEDGEINASRYGIDAPLAVGDAVRVSWLPENAVIVDTGGRGG